MIKAPADPTLARRRFYRFWFPDWPAMRVWEVAELWRDLLPVKWWERWETSRRAEFAATLRRNGFKLKEVAKRLGVCPERARQLANRAERRSSRRLYETANDLADVERQLIAWKHLRVSRPKT